MIKRRMGSPLEHLPAVPPQIAVIRMVTNLMGLQCNGMVTDGEYLTIRKRIADWDFAHADKLHPEHIKGGLASKVLAKLKKIA